MTEKLTISEAEKKTDELHEQIEVVGEWLKHNFIHPLQQERFEDFKWEVLGIADAEISTAKNLHRIQNDIENYEETVGVH